MTNLHLNKRQSKLASWSLLVAMAVVNIAFVAIQPTDAYLPRPEAMRLCRQRTGLTDKDIDNYKPRNEFCAIDCITKQGTLMTVHTDDGSPCHDQDGYKCTFGKCRSPDDRDSDAEIKADLNDIQLSIKSAHVADRDPYPGQGESDAFVVVELVSDGGPSFKDGEVLCHTHVIQDSSRPKWNFVCKPQPMKGSARLRFVVLDSDKPDTDPQLLGYSVQTLDSLMNAGVQTLALENQNKLTGGPFWIEVEISGKKYNPNE